jgi:hypothetical protein
MAQDEQTHLDAQDARSGETSGVMRYVLLISLVLVVVIFAAIILLR